MAAKQIQVIVVGNSTSAQAALKQLQTVATGADSALARMGSHAQVWGRGMTTAGSKLSRWVTAPIIGAGIAATHLASQFDQSMRNVNSIMGVSEAELSKYSDAVLKMSTRFPQDAQTLSAGLYDIASSGFQGADGLKVLEASARAASAGMSETATSAKAITSVLNAYGLSAQQAGHVSDVLFTGVDKGVMTFDELAGSIGNYIGAASQLKIPLEQVVGAQAAMTLSGISAAEGAVSLNGILKTLLKPSTDLAKALKQMGYESGQAALEGEGLDGLMAKLSATVGDDKSMWVKLFPEIRAARGAMALAANDGDNLTRVMDEMATSTGHTADAFKEQAKGPAFQFTLALNRLKKVGIELGNELIPILTHDLIPAFEKAVKWWDQLSDSEKEMALKLVGVTAVLGPFLRVFGPAVSLFGKAAVWLPKVVPWLARWGAIKSFPVPPTTVTPVGGGGGGSGLLGAILGEGGIALGLDMATKTGWDAAVLEAYNEATGTAAEGNAALNRVIGETSRLTAHESQAVGRVIGKFVALGGQMTATDKKQLKFFATVGDGATALSYLRTMLEKLRTAQKRSEQASRTQNEQTKKLFDTFGGAAGKAAYLAQKFGETSDKADTARDRTKDLNDELGLIPAFVRSRLELDTADAWAEIRRIQAALRELDGGSGGGGGGGGGGTGTGGHRDKGSTTVTIDRKTFARETTRSLVTSGR